MARKRDYRLGTEKILAIQKQVSFIKQALIDHTCKCGTIIYKTDECYHVQGSKEYICVDCAIDKHILDNASKKEKLRRKKYLIKEITK